ncbi:MAG: hypothetical protein E7220_08835, partial [Clostridiales bacterium]|nr:hypothetical protein [Clostridiales bacterium]
MTKTKSGTITSTDFRIAAKRSYPDLSCVKLLQGTPFYERQQEMNAWLLAQNDDSMLYNFRKAAGLSVREADPMTGWDADECKLKGHTTGHYMSGLSLAYAATGDKRYRDKLTYLIGSLKECRDAFAGMEGYHEGFLSAYSEEQFDLLEKMTPYPDIWAPYYTLEKIISGLLDAYELADCGAAMDILDPLGSWVFNRLSGLTEELRSKMWDTYIAGEYGFMMSAMLRLYRHTGREEHLEAAKMFSNPKLFNQMAAGTDQLDTMHANQHIPQAIGAQELFIETGMPEYSDIARNFWTIVTGHHCYAIGGTGEQERFHAADSECSFLTESTAESCASYNMLRLTSLLFRFESDDHLRGKMDYFERTLFNHIMMSCSHAPDGGTTYFMPLAPGS